MNKIVKILKNKSITTSAKYTISNALPQVINFLLLPLYTRLLVPKEFGYLGYIQSIITFLSITNSLSLNVYFVRKYFYCKDKKEFTSTIFLFLLFSGIVLIISELIFIWFSVGKFKINIPYFPIIILGVLGFFFTSFNLIPLRYLRLNENVNKFVWYTVSLVIIENCVAIILMTVFKLGVVGKLLAYSGTAAIFAIFYSILVLKQVGISFNKQIIKKGLKFSIPLIPSAYATVALTMADRIIMERYISMTIIGVYSVAYSIASAAKFITNAMYFTLEPKIFSKSKEENFLTWFISVKKIFLIIIPIIISPLIFFSNEIIVLFLDDKYYSAIPLIPLISISTIFLGMTALYTPLIILKDKTIQTSIITLIAAISNIVLNILFIPKYGVYAAAVSTLFCYFIIAFLTIFLASRLYKNKINIGCELFIILILGVALTSMYQFNMFDTEQTFIIRLLAFLIFCISMGFLGYYIKKPNLKR